MGDEESGGGNSVGTSCATPLINWWDVQATSSLSSWNTTHNHVPSNHDSNSSSCCDEVHHLSVSSDNHLWTHVLLGVGSNEEVQNREEAGGENNLMDEMSSKSIMYEPTAAACSNYLKKLDTTWDYNHSSSSSSINTCSTTTFDHKNHFNPNTNNNNNNNNNNNGYNDDEAMLESSERSTTTWSIAPPHNHHINDSQFDPPPPPPPPHHHHQTHNHNNDNNFNSCVDHCGVFSSYGSLDMKVKQQQHLHHHDAASEGLLGYQNNSGFNNNNHHYGMMPTSLSRNLTDVISFTGRIGRPIIGVHALKPTFRPPSFMTTLSDHHSKKHLFHTSSFQTRNGRGQGSSTEVKKKRTDHDPSSQPILKKQKQDTTSTPSSTKVQAPKVKLGDRITTLQQIVSPFGKTDTASVLFEAIGYIKFLQEQVQLLSNSYMKTNSHRESTWGSMERKEEKGDLKSRGLCLVPISWTPQAYRDNTAPDYWTPAYRGCLFR